MASRSVSSSKLEANRRNAQKSTGPRSRAGKIRSGRNSLKHGRYSGAGGYGRLVESTMQDLGEDAAEFSRLEQSLIEEWQPQGISPTLLVEDLASLRWERQRLERARAALVARRVQELELKHQRASLEVDRKITERMPAVFLQAGMIWAPDSATKFQKLLESLNMVDRQMEKKTRLLWAMQDRQAPQEPPEDEPNRGGKGRGRGRGRGSSPGVGGPSPAPDVGAGLALPVSGSADVGVPLAAPDVGAGLALPLPADRKRRKKNV